MVLPYINMNLPRVYTCSPSWTPLPPPSPYHPSGLSQCNCPKHPISCIEPGLVICFLYDIIHVSMPFFQIIPPSSSPTESKRLLYTSVSLLLSHIQDYRRRQWQPTPVFLPGESQGQRSLVGCHLWGRTRLKRLSSSIQDYCYHLSEFHIYALVYCIGVFISGLLHSV